MVRVVSQWQYFVCDWDFAKNCWKEPFLTIFLCFIVLFGNPVKYFDQKLGALYFIMAKGVSAHYVVLGWSEMAPKGSLLLPGRKQLYSLFLDVFFGRVRIHICSKDAVRVLNRIFVRAHQVFFQHLV